MPFLPTIEAMARPKEPPPMTATCSSQEMEGRREGRPIENYATRETGKPKGNVAIDALHAREGGLIDS